MKPVLNIWGSTEVIRYSKICKIYHEVCQAMMAIRRMMSFFVFKSTGCLGVKICLEFTSNTKQVWKHCSPWWSYFILLVTEMGVAYNTHLAAFYCLPRVFCVLMAEEQASSASGEPLSKALVMQHGLWTSMWTWLHIKVTLDFGGHICFFAVSTTWSWSGVGGGGLWAPWSWSTVFLSKHNHRNTFGHHDG